MIEPTAPQTTGTDITPLARCRSALKANGFEVFSVGSSEEANRLFFDLILPGIRLRTASWGDSLTLEATGILESLSGRSGIEIIRTFEKDVPRAELIERRRQALLTDLFFTGANAITETGTLVNLDMIGNRVAGLAFGPKKVVVLAGRNKIVPDLESAVARIRTKAAPRNTQRHGLDTPCAVDGECRDCRSPRRICNTWAVTERCFPSGRIKVILIDRDLGL